MPDASESVRAKVQAIFAGLVGKRAQVLESTMFPGAITSAVAAALSGPAASEATVLHNDQLAFHLTDWASDAAFVVALHLFPERFTPEEVEAGVISLLVHVPGHVVTAAKLGGYSTEDLLGDLT